MEKTHGYSTLHSTDYSTRGHGQALRFPLPPGSYPLPPERKKRPWTRFSADQLQHLEATFQEDALPATEKKKAIAASFGVTLKIIMVWFRNRRAKWRKEKARKAKAGHGQSTAGSTPQHQISPTLPTLARSSKGAPILSCSTEPPQPAPVPPSVPISSTQMAPSRSSVLSSLSSPGRSRDTGQQQLSSQQGLVEFPPHPMHNPPSLLQENFPPFTTTNNSANPTPPLLNTPAHTPPFFLDALAGGATLAHHETQSLLTDTSSLFDLDYLTSSRQNNTYQLQASYPTSQPELHPDTSLPSMPYLTPSYCLTPNPPELNPTSYLTLGPEGNSSGVGTTSTCDPAYFQSQSMGQIPLQSSD